MSTKAVRPTEKNYKIKTDLGKERLQASLKSFGLAGTVIVNTDMMLIDGNSRLQEALEAGEPKIWVSMPNRKLTPKEFQEMSAMYDFAKAGEIDMDSIEKDLGTSKDFYEKYAMAVPLHLLDKMGNKAPIAGLEYPDERGEAVEAPLSNNVQIALLYSAKEEKVFREMEEIIRKKFKVATTKDAVLKAMKVATGKK